MLPNIYTELRLCFFVFFCFTNQHRFHEELYKRLTVAQITKLLKVNGKKVPREEKKDNGKKVPREEKEVNGEKVPRKNKKGRVDDLMTFFLIQHRAKSN